jgi:hypothetical protein
MKANMFIHCNDFPCLDTRRESYLIPAIDIDQANVSILLISEATLTARANLNRASQAQ